MSTETNILVFTYKKGETTHCLNERKSSHKEESGLTTYKGSIGTVGRDERGTFDQ